MGLVPSLAGSNSVIADSPQSTERRSYKETQSALGSIIGIKIDVQSLCRRAHPFLFMLGLSLPVLQCIDLFCDSNARFELVQKMMLNVHLWDVRDFWLVISID